MNLILLRQFVVFGLVGLVGFIVDAGVLYLASPHLGWYGGRVLSFGAAATTTWQLNRTITFSAAFDTKEQKLIREYLSYVWLMLGGAGVNYAAYVVVLLSLSNPVAPFIGVAVGSIAGMGINFVFAHRLLSYGQVFKTKSVKDK